MDILSFFPKFEQPLNEAIYAVQKAASHIVTSALENKILTCELKVDLTIVMNLDLELQDILLENLSSLPIVSEELPESHAIIGSNGDFFVVDPLDGTTSAKRFFNAVDSQVGFGPMVGVVKSGKLEGVVFYNTPMRSFYVAERGKGSYELKDDFESPAKKLEINKNIPLNECGVLFFAGLNGELDIIKKLKISGAVENIYRFGGFANDCSRLARGLEQIQIQFSVKAWDLPAALLSSEAGLSVIMDPMNIIDSNQTLIQDWSVRKENPLLTVPPQLLTDFQKLLS